MPRSALDYRRLFRLCFSLFCVCEGCWQYVQHKRVQLFFLKCTLIVFSCARFHFISLFWNNFSSFVFVFCLFVVFVFLLLQMTICLANMKRNGLKRHQLMCVYLFIYLFYSISVARVHDGSSVRFPVNFVRWFAFWKLAPLLTLPAPLSAPNYSGHLALPLHALHASANPWPSSIQASIPLIGQSRGRR